jgi:dTDP-4-dehydrorhamnose 3,5-epimerase
MLWIPPGFGHAFLALEPGTEVLYKCTDFHAPGDAHCIRWDDPAIGIAWPLGELTPILSGKDQAGLPFAAAELYP